MTNRAIKKTLSIVLVIAICISTVCGSIMGVNAATGDATYSIVGQDIAAGTKTTTMTVTITDPDGIQSGSFDLMFGSAVIDDVNFDSDGNYVDDVSAVADTLDKFLGDKNYTEWVDTGTTDEFTSAPAGDETTQWVKASETPTKYEYSAWADSDTGNYYETAPTVSTTEPIIEQWIKDENKSPTYEYEWSDANPTETVWTDTAFSEGGVATGGETTWTFSSATGILGSSYTKATKDSTVTVDDDTQWIFTGETKTAKKNNSFSNDTTFYELKKQTKTIASTKYYYIKQTRTVTATYYQFKEQTRDLTYTGGYDTDGNKMIATENVYKTVDVKDENGVKIGEKQVVDIEATKAGSENISNKGVLLPNAYDKTNGLFNTKIEITGGTKANGDIATDAEIAEHFTNDKYQGTDIADDTTTLYIEGKTTDSREYVYKLTEDYYNAYEIERKREQKTILDADGNEVKVSVANDELLHGYYREYTTVDVETSTLSYDISTVSEDSIGQMNPYSQYAQGFKNITFNSSEKYTSITFTVTLDFTGNCDRVSAHNGVDNRSGNGFVNTATATDGTEISYRVADNRYAGENYIQYGTKYQLNLFNLADENGDAIDISSAGTNVNTDYFHVHSGRIPEAVGTADPVNKDAIKALGDAKEGTDYFELYNATCDTCGRVTPMIASPDLPYRVTQQNADGTTSSVSPTTGKGSYGYNNFRNISGISLEYKNDGSVSLNIHLPNSMVGEQIIITDENGIVMDYSDVVDGSDVNYESYDAKYYSEENANGEDTDCHKASFWKAEKGTTSKYDGLLLSSAKMITIDGLSAADADKTLYIARYTPVSETETQLMGITHAISLTDYCNEVIKGENVYYLGDENYSETKEDDLKVLDKQVAAAFINYAKASKIALNTADDYKARNKTDVWEPNEKLNQKYDENNLLDGKLADKKETGTDWDNAIIIDNAEELAYLCLQGGDKTAGKYYKVADGIKAFYMNPSVTEETAYDTAKTTLAEEYYYWNCSAPFQGHFDGNGVIITGIQTNPNGAYAGLFPQITNDVTVKNVTITNCRFEGVSGGVAAVVGRYVEINTDTTQTKPTDVSDLTFEKISVYNCYINSTKSTIGAGAILGYAGNCTSYTGSWVNGAINFNNCYINLTEDMLVSASYDAGTANATHGGIAAYIGTSTAYATDCVVIGIAPYTRRVITTYPHVQSSGWQFAKKDCFTNIYTTHTCDDGYSNGQDSDKDNNTDADTAAAKQDYTGRIFTFTEDEMKGTDAITNMSALDWDFTWKTTNSYPELYTPYNTPSEAREKTIYYTGSDNTIGKTAPAGMDDETQGTKENPIIISTVEELAYVVGQSYDNAAATAGRYFKIADGIKNIVLQKSDYVKTIMGFTTTEQVEEFFTDDSNTIVSWPSYGWEAATFCGNIDFNGATVYGLYQNVTDKNAGLISTIDSGAAIHNLTVKNSYMVSTSTNTTDTSKQYNIGAIAAYSNGVQKNIGTSDAPNYVTCGKGEHGVVWAENCTVANNYMCNNSTSADRSGVMLGNLSDAVYIDNCLVYGNDAKYGQGDSMIDMPLTGAAKNNVDITDVPDSLVTNVDSEGYHFNMVRGSVILGATPYNAEKNSGARFNDVRCYSNVYTDAPTGTVTFANGNLTFTNAQLKAVTAQEIYGLSAKSTMTELDWYDIATNPDGAWHCSYLGAMPSLTPLNESFADYLANFGLSSSAYDIEFEQYEDEFGYSVTIDDSMQFGVYTTSVNLKANPFMSFIFAFHGEYKTNREKISVKFEYTLDGDKVETDWVAVPAYQEGVELRDGNWINGAKNGRYHTYMFKGLPVEALANGVTVYAKYTGDTENTDPIDEQNLGTFSAKGLGYEISKLITEETPSEYYSTRVEAIKALAFYAETIRQRYGTATA